MANHKNRIPHNEAAINSYATRCFRDTADMDYIHARLAYRYNLFNQFRWSALHCLEKYCKCILLLNRISSKNISHEVSKSLQALADSGKFSIVLSKQTESFIKHLESGTDRYFVYSWNILPGSLQRLDQAVVEIRRYCKIFDYEIEKDGRIINLFDLEIKRVQWDQSTPIKNIPIISGLIESRIEKNHPSAEALLWDNELFGDPDTNPRATIDYYESQVSPFDLHPEAINELSKLIKIPKDIIQDTNKRKY